MVLLTQDAYERLEAARRQGGAQANRIRSLNQKLSETTAFLDGLERAVAELPACQLGHPGSCRKAGTDCVRHRVLAMLQAHPGSERQGMSASRDCTGT